MVLAGAAGNGVTAGAIIPAALPRKANRSRVGTIATLGLVVFRKNASAPLRPRICPGRAQRFSWWMTTMLHQPAGANAFDRRRQLAELDCLTGSQNAQRALAENYTGLPFD
jgi:hypothetical protein